MSSPISTLARSKVRARFERDMIDTVVIDRGGLGAFDPVTGITAGGSTTQIYHGKARLPKVSSAGEVSLGEGEIKMRQVECLIPWDSALVRINDTVGIEAAQDAQLVGTSWRVIGVDGGGSWMAMRTLTLSGWYPDTTTWTGAA